MKFGVLNTAFNVKGVYCTLKHFVRCRHVLRQFLHLLGKDRKIKKFRMPSGKRRVHSVSGRHIDDRWRKAPDIFRKASEVFFIISDLYRVVTEIAEVHADISRSVLKCIIPISP